MNHVTVLPAIAAAAISTVTDLRRGYIYDRILLPAGLAVGILAAIEGAMLSTCAGALAGSGSLLALHAMTKGRGIGLGDVKFAAVLGAAIGAVGALEMLAVAFVSGGAIAIILLAAGRKRRGDTMAFAPFLTAGFCAVVIGGIGT